MDEDEHSINTNKITNNNSNKAVLIHTFQVPLNRVAEQEVPVIDVGQPLREGQRTESDHDTTIAINITQYLCMCQKATHR